MDVAHINEHDKKSLFRELFILSTLHHPNIVELKEAFQEPEESLFYMVFELLKGGSLSKSIQHYEYIPEE